MHCTHTTPP